MALISAGLLMCRVRSGGLEYFLVHPGGPFFARKNQGVWGIPKGLVDPGESVEACAEREFREETGITPAGPFHPLGTVKNKSGKTIHAWAFLGDWDLSNGIASNYIQLEWPPHSGKRISIPEIDKADWMEMETAKRMITAAQIPFLERAEFIFSTGIDISRK